MAWRNMLKNIGEFGQKIVSGGEGGVIFSPSVEDVPSSMTIGKNHIRFTRKLDEGGFSFVYSAIDTSTNVAYAVKRLLIQTKEQRSTINNEIKVMKQCNGHPSLIELIGEKFDRINENMVVWLLMELGEESVLGIMNKRLLKFSNPSEGSSPLSPQVAGTPQFSERQVLQIFFDISCGIAHLHSQTPPILHRDIKVENVLKIGKKFKLCDFGSCTTKIYDLIQKSERLRAEEDLNKNTTMEYRAPEMVDLFLDKEINTPSDIWALGCLLYKLMYFQGPFDDDGNGLKIMSGKYDMPPRAFLERERQFQRKNPNVPFTDYSPALPKLVKAMLRKRACKRPDIFTIIEHVGSLLDLPENEIPQRGGGMGGSNEGFNNEEQEHRNMISPEAIDSPYNENSGFIEDEIRAAAGKRGKKRKKGVRKKKKKEVSLWDALKEPDCDGNNNNNRSKKTVVVDDWDPDFDSFDMPQKKNSPKKEIKSQKQTTPQDQDDEEMDLFTQLDWQESGTNNNNNNNKSNSGGSKMRKPLSIEKKKKTNPGPMATLRGTGPINRQRVQSSPSSLKKEKEVSFKWGSGFDEDDMPPPQKKTKKSPRKKMIVTPPSGSANDNNIPFKNSANKYSTRPHSSPPEKKKNRANDTESFSLINFDGPSQAKKGSSSFRIPPSKTTLGLPSSNVHPRTKSFDAFNLPKSLDRLYRQPTTPTRPLQHPHVTFRAGYQPVRTQGYYQNQHLMNPNQRNVSSDVAFIKQLVNQKKEEMRKSKSQDEFPF